MKKYSTLFLWISLSITLLACSTLETNADITSPHTPLSNDKTQTTSTHEAMQAPIVNSTTIAATQTGIAEDALTNIITPTFGPPTLTPTPLIKATSTAPLSADGPWILLKSYDSEGAYVEYYAINEDGSGLEILFQAPRNSYWLFEETIRIEPDSGKFMDFYVDGHYFGQPELWMVDLQTLDIKMLTKLISDDIYLEDEGDHAIEDIYVDRYASTMHGNWSNDGKQFVFSAWLTGDTPDLYIYQLDSEKITKLTDVTNIPVLPFWSPDDRYIIYAGVTYLGFESSGSGYGDWKIWAVDLETGQKSKLFDGLDYGWEKITGWINDEAYLGYSYQSWLGDFNLRTINVHGQIEQLWCATFEKYSFNPITQEVLLFHLEESQAQVPENCEHDIKTGVYRISIQDGTSTFITSENMGLAYGESVQRFILSDVDNDYLLSTSNELIVYGERKQLSRPYHKTMVWHADNQSYYYYEIEFRIDETEGAIFVSKLYRVFLPDMHEELILEIPVELNQMWFIP